VSLPASGRDETAEPSALQDLLPGLPERSYSFSFWPKVRPLTGGQTTNGGGVLACQRAVALPLTRARSLSPSLKLSLTVSHTPAVLRWIRQQMDSSVVLDPVWGRVSLYDLGLLIDRRWWGRGILDEEGVHWLRHTLLQHFGITTPLTICLRLSPSPPPLSALRPPPSSLSLLRIG
jgi:hypothetical protein